jgi:hypothetical protein
VQHRASGVEHCLDLSQYYSLSKRTGLYALEAFQRANGNTLAVESGTRGGRGHHSPLLIGAVNSIEVVLSLVRFDAQAMPSRSPSKSSLGDVSCDSGLQAITEITGYVFVTATSLRVAETAAAAMTAAPPQHD